MSPEVARSAEKAARHPIVRKLARPGFAARGVVYALLGLLALRIAFGEGGEADKSGAIHTVAAQPFGEILLWIMAIGLAALTIWQLSEAQFGRGGVKERVEALARAAVYGLMVFSIVGLLTAGTRATSTDSQSKDVTRALFELPGGPVIVALLAVGLVALGGFWIYEGWARRFMKDMLVTGPKARAIVPKLGAAGYVARGVIAIAAGTLIGRAAITYDPSRAAGIDKALKSLAELPLGPVVLAAVAVGLLLFALYCFAESRWHRT